MSKSKKGLSFAEQVCKQARQELDACQGHSDEIEKIYSKLCFISRQIKVQVTTVESLLRIARSRLGELSAASRDLQKDLKTVSLRMDQALRALRNKEVDPEIQKTRQQGGQSMPHEGRAVLFDFLDEVRLQQLHRESNERMNRIQSTTTRLEELIYHFSEQRTEFKGYLTNAITLDESALSFAREKMLLQEHHTTTMAESLVSLANHYDQVAGVLTADIQPTDEELGVLEGDTAEVLVIIEELEDSLALVQATSEEIGVREHLYMTAYQEAVAFFKRIEALEPELVELIDVFKTADTLEGDFEETSKLVAEIDNLAIWYEEFYNSYGAMTVEIMRRHQAHQIQQTLVKEFTEKMKSALADEMHHRTVFSEKHDKYLPVDLCPAFADPPMQHEIVTHGSWRLPMPTRATLQLVEGRIREMEGL
ncbi:autophagy-related protein 17 [Entomortierella parvispora]|uniref:Autophagy-related protein 17 n=1 Tax=Entomortierella parvispora TaxID=205924 RepID=A0A9P3HL03_9FUNG|nr:autophagy-related protein 17 [Entomortierella parvispora]